MDGLSAVASICTLVELSAKLLSTCYQYRKEVKGATKEIQSIIDQLASLKWVLERLEQLENTRPPSQPTTLGQLVGTAGPLHQCEEVLKGLMAKLDPAKRWEWPLRSSGIKNTLESVEILKSTLILALSSDQVANQRSLDKRVEQLTTKLTSVHVADKADRDRESEVQAQLKDDKQLRQNVINWLSTTKPSTNHNSNRRKHQRGTGEWFTQGPKFEKWRTNPNSFVWLYGSTGCGKTILSSTIIDYIQLNHVVKTKSALAYYYFDFNDTSKQKSANFVSSLLADLYTQNSELPNSAKQLYFECNDGHREPSLRDLVFAFLDVLSSFEDVFVVVDALDECPTEDDERENLLRIIEEIHANSSASLHFLATSRRHFDIEDAIGPLASIQPIEIETAVVDNDIRAYIQSEVQKMRKKQRWWKDDLCQEVEDAVVNGANGMFRWAYCQMNDLKSCLRAADIRAKLNKLPKNLKDTYVRMLASIAEDYREDAHTALRWLVFSERPLRMDELAEALRVDPTRDPPVDTQPRLSDPDQILQILPDLATIGPLDKNYSREIKLAHFSVKEFLVEEGFKTEMPPLLSPLNLNQAFMAQSCLFYLLFYEGSSQKTFSETDLLSFPLLSYACEYWLNHRKAFNDGEESKSVVQKLALDDIVSKLFTLLHAPLAWLQVYRQDGTHITPFSRRFPVVTPLYYAAYFGFHQIIERLLDMHQDINAEGGFYGTPLQVACKEGPTDTVCLLLERGAEINAIPESGNNVLHDAVSRKDVGLVEFLISRGADTEVQNHRGNTPLIVAAKIGACEVIEILLQHRANINGVGQTHLSDMFAFSSPLSTATMTRNYSAIKLLLERGAKADQKDMYKRTALYWALNFGNLDIIELFVDFGADLNTVDDRGDTPLLISLEGRRDPEVVQLLLDRGVDVRIQNIRGSTALSALLNQECSNSLDPWKGITWPDLHAFVRILLDAGADPTAQDKFRKTPLDYAQKWRSKISVAETPKQAMVFDKIIDILIEAEEAWGQKHGAFIPVGRILSPLQRHSSHRTVKSSPHRRVRKRTL